MILIIGLGISNTVVASDLFLDGTSFNSHRKTNYRFDLSDVKFTCAALGTYGNGALDPGENCDGSADPSGCPEGYSCNACSNSCTTTSSSSTSSSTGGACVEINCDDNDPCTEDACAVDDFNNGYCTHTIPGTCCTGVHAISCDDNNACTTDSCDPVSGCANNAIVGCCNTGADCTGENVCCNGSCQDSCPSGELCGNGTKEGTEQCDDGNTANSDGCSATCTIEPPPKICGDGIVDPPEECDDGNTNNNDSCLNTCANAICGDNYVRAGVEQCEVGNNTNIDGCSDTCQLECIENQ